MTALLAFGFGAAPADAQQAPLGGDAHVRAATVIAQRLVAGSFDTVAAAVDPKVPAGVFSADALRKIWGDAGVQLGRLTAFTPLRSFPVQWTHVVDFDAHFERQHLTLRIVVDDEGRLSGLFFRAPESPAAEAAAYVDAAAFTEREVTLGADPWKLPGTLSVPKGAGPFPAVVLVHGSGPNDRDETIGPNRPLRDLAQGLASRGIAVLRYDKRTRVHGARMVGLDIGLEEEVVADALSALDTLRQTPGVDARAVFLLGHSLGATMAPVIAARDRRLAGAILMAAAATDSMTELAAEQVRYIASLQPTPNAELQALIATFDSLRAGQLPDDRNIIGAPVRYWREVDAVHPVEKVRLIATPLLFLQGGRDYQVPPRELGVWRRELAGRPHTSFREFPALNHLFMRGTGPSSPAEYMTPSHVDAEVVDAIAAWIRGTGERQD